MCQKEFSFKRSGTRHLQLVHCSNEKQQCPFCFAWSKNKNSLDQHIRLLHKKGLTKQKL